ncbi:MAG: AAA family ATPase, partial [Bacteroidota bacterium]
KNHHQYQLREYWFWRDSNHNEIDLLTKKGMQFDIFEIKSTETVLPKLFKGLDYFEHITKKVNRSTLIYGGSENQNRTKYFVRNWESAI